MVYRAKRDPESRFFRLPWIPAFEGMTVFRTFARASAYRKSPKISKKNF